VSGERLTQYVLVANLLLLVVYDIFVWRHFGVGATISRVLWHAVRDHAFLGLAFGALIFHLFMQPKPEDGAEK
jgi:hypothetical protein